MTVKGPSRLLTLRAIRRIFPARCETHASRPEAGATCAASTDDQGCCEREAEAVAALEARTRGDRCRPSALRVLRLAADRAHGGRGRAPRRPLGAVELLQVPLRRRGPRGQPRRGSHHDLGGAGLRHAARRLVGRPGHLHPRLGVDEAEPAGPRRPPLRVEVEGPGPGHSLGNRCRHRHRAGAAARFAPFRGAWLRVRGPRDHP